MKLSCSSLQRQLCLLWPLCIAVWPVYTAPNSSVWSPFLIFTYLACSSPALSYYFLLIPVWLSWSGTHSTIFSVWFACLSIASATSIQAAGFVIFVCSSAWPSCSHKISGNLRVFSEHFCEANWWIYEFWFSKSAHVCSLDPAFWQSLSMTSLSIMRWSIDSHVFCEIDWYQFQCWKIRLSLS